MERIVGHTKEMPTTVRQEPAPLISRAPMEIQSVKVRQS